MAKKKQPAKKTKTKPAATKSPPPDRKGTEAHVHYHKDGSIWAKGEMTDGVMTGYWEWFRKDGTVMRTGYFVNGVQTGEWTTFDKHGKVVKVTTMKPKQKPKT
jgi:antitoxin component YwqK of YwqJK toxin-antitoxin module